MTMTYLHTNGSQILDANNQPFRIAGVSWFGMETTTMLPGGLGDQNYRDMLKQIKQLGFNTVRLPFSTQAIDPATPALPNNAILASVNPELNKLKPLQIIDKIVAAATDLDLRILLDRHRVTAGDGPEESGFWYSAAYPATRWISDWTMLAQRYANNPTVIGADLHNEPQGNSVDIEWNNIDPQFGWASAAQQCGNAILAVNPNWLIVVEGVTRTPVDDFYWFGGNLKDAAVAPVNLDVPGQLVYSPHDYPPRVFDQPWFDPAAGFPNNLADKFETYWGYLSTQGTAPIILGEFGSWLSDTDPPAAAQKERDWGKAIKKYLAANSAMGWIWWSWNPDSSDTGGVLSDDWKTPRQEVLDLLQSIMP